MCMEYLHIFIHKYFAVSLGNFFFKSKNKYWDVNTGHWNLLIEAWECFIPYPSSTTICQTFRHRFVGGCKTWSCGHRSLRTGGGGYWIAKRRAWNPSYKLSTSVISRFPMKITTHAKTVFTIFVLSQNILPVKESWQGLMWSDWETNGPL